MSADGPRIWRSSDYGPCRLSTSALGRDTLQCIRDDPDISPKDDGFYRRPARKIERSVSGWAATKPPRSFRIMSLRSNCTEA